MNPKDRMILMAGVVAILLSAGFGTALATGPIMDDDDGPALVADWSINPSVTNTFDEENTQVLEVAIDEHNITSLVATLTWTDDEIVNIGGPRADVLTLMVEGPPGLGVTQPQQSGTSGELQVTFVLDPPPVDPDPDNFENYDRVNATGTWVISVTVDANGIRDTGNAWSLTLRAA
jgi:hypothetical protein